jgi:hypothetical protein
MYYLQYNNKIVTHQNKFVSSWPWLNRVDTREMSTGTVAVDTGDKAVEHSDTGHKPARELGFPLDREHRKLARIFADSVIHHYCSSLGLSRRGERPENCVNVFLSFKNACETPEL